MEDFSRKEMQNVIFKLKRWALIKFDGTWREMILVAVAGILEAFLIGLEEEGGRT